MSAKGHPTLDYEGFLATGFLYKPDQWDNLNDELGLKHLNIGVYFTFIGMAQAHLTNETIIRLAIHWFNKFDADGILTYEQESVILFQKDGQVIINSDTDFWHAEYSELLKRPYIYKPIPVL